MVPALAIGFDDLQKRVEAQDKQAALHQEKLKVITFLPVVLLIPQHRSGTARPSIRPFANPSSVQYPPLDASPPNTYLNQTPTTPAH